MPERAAGRWTMKSATSACAAWLPPSSTNMASRWEACPYPAPLCASPPSGWPRSGRQCGTRRRKSPSSAAAGVEEVASPSAHAAHMAQIEGEHHEADHEGDTCPVDLHAPEHPDGVEQQHPGGKHDQGDDDETDH